MNRFRSELGRLSRAQKFAASALIVAIGFELADWAVFPFTGYDSFSHIFWIGEWHKMWQTGIFYPRWLPDSFQGFGAPSFYYYPPLTYILSSVIYEVLPNFSPDAIGKAVALIAFAISGLSMWLYLRWRSREGGDGKDWNIAIILSSLIYAFAPYRIFNYATRGALPEHIAFVFVPFVFWGADLVMQRQDGVRRGVTILIAAFSLLIVTNLPAASVAGIGVFIYMLAGVSQSRLRNLKLLLFAAIAAMLVTSFYILPVIAMFGDVQLGRLWRPVPVVLSSPFLAIFTGQAITINSYTFVSIVGACILCVGWIRRRMTANPFFWLLAVIIAVQLPFIAKYLFVYVPPFNIAQLSYRMSILLLVIVAISWQKELSKSKMLEDKLKYSHVASIVVAFWSICTIILVGLQLADVHVHKHGPRPVGEAPEYTTRWARPNYESGPMLSTPFANDSQNIIWQDRFQVSILSSIRKPYSDTIIYEAQTEGLATIRRAYWPEWKASIDGMSAATAPDSLGRLTVVVPKGKHSLVLQLETSRAEEMGAWISISSLLALTASWIFTPRYRKSIKYPKNRPRNPKESA